MPCFWRNGNEVFCTEVSKDTSLLGLKCPQHLSNANISSTKEPYRTEVQQLYGRKVGQLLPQIIMVMISNNNSIKRFIGKCCCNKCCNEIHSLIEITL